MPLVRHSPSFSTTRPMLSQSNMRFDMTGNGGIKLELTPWDTLQDFFRRLYDMLRGTNSSPDNLQERFNKLQMRLDNLDSEISHHPFKGVFDPFIDLKNLFPEEMQKKFSVIIDYNQTDLSAGKISVSIKYNNYLLKKIVIDNALRLNNDDIKEHIEEHFNVVTPTYNFSGNFPIKNAHSDLKKIQELSDQYLDTCKNLDTREKGYTSEYYDLPSCYENLIENIKLFFLRLDMDSRILIRSDSSLSNVEQTELAKEININLSYEASNIFKKLGDTSTLQKYINLMHFVKN